jgi:hypothetical protein
VLDGAAGTDIDLQHDSLVDEGTRLRSEEERSEGESDDENEISAGPQLEPRRPHCAETHVTSQDTAAVDTTDENSAQADSDPSLCGVRGLAESQLEQRPFVVSYPTKTVGDPVRARTTAQDHRDCQSAHANASYELEIARDETNPYAPFASKLDWDIAKWAKLRGPGSTSFSELMAIPGVCTSPSIFESGQVTLSRYMRNFRYHSEAIKNSTSSSTTNYQGGHRLSVMKS